MQHSLVLGSDMGETGYRKDPSTASLWSVESSNFRDSFKYCPAKYTALPVQHTRTQKKCLPCLKFGTRISELPLKYGKASSTRQ